MKRVWQRLKHMLLAIIWPERVYCLGCGRLTGGSLLCRSCEQELEVHRLPKRPKELWETVWAYGGAAKRLVHVLKFDGVTDAAIPLAKGMSEKARTLGLPPDTVVTWVTMPTSRRLERGVDHGRCLAEAVARELNLPAREILARSDAIGRKTQRSLKGEQRKLNLEGAFSCPEQLHEPVLLVDDVCTTGATTTICYECLLLAGAPQVFVLTATRVI